MELCFDENNGICLKQMEKEKIFDEGKKQSGGNKESFPLGKQLADKLKGKLTNSRIEFENKIVSWGYAAKSSGFSYSALRNPEPHIYMQIKKKSEVDWSVSIIKKPEDGWNILFENGNKTPIQLDGSNNLKEEVKSMESLTEENLDELAKMIMELLR